MNGYIRPSSATDAIYLPSDNSTADCYNTAGSLTNCGGSTTAAPPYIEIGSTFYDHDFYAVTKPPVCGSTTWLNSVAPSSCTNGTNGDVLAQTTSTINAWASQTATTSVEGVHASTTNLAFGSFAQSVIWIYDSTNSKFYALVQILAGSTSTQVQSSLQIWACASPCSSVTPTFSSQTETPTGAYGFGAHAHLKLSVSGGTLTAASSIDGGSTFVTLSTVSVGTITKGGYVLEGGSSGTAAEDVISINVQ